MSEGTTKPIDEWKDPTERPTRSSVASFKCARLPSGEIGTSESRTRRDARRRARIGAPLNDKIGF